MSILSKYEIKQARFTNVAHDTIEVMLFDKVRDVHFPHYVSPLDLEGEDLKYLLDHGWDFERIIATTTAHNKSEASALKQIHRYLAQKEIALMEEKLKEKLEALKQTELEKSNIIAAIVENNRDEEAVFRAKLAVFEIPAVRESKDKTLKSDIRKSTTIVELLTLIKSLV